MQDHAHLVDRSAFTLGSNGKPSKDIVKTLCGKAIKITNVSTVELPNHNACFDNIEASVAESPRFWVVGGTKV